MWNMDNDIHRLGNPLEIFRWKIADKQIFS